MDNADETTEDRYAVTPDEVQVVLDAASESNAHVLYAGMRWRFHKCGGPRYYIATLVGRPRPGVSSSIACHIAIDGTLRCSAAGQFGKFFPYATD